MRLIYSLLFLSCSLFCISQQTIRHTVYFDFDEELPSATSHTALLAFVNTIKTMPVTTIDVLGFTDKKGSHAYNDELSAQRAHAVANFLGNSLSKNIPLNIDYFGKDSLVTTHDAQQRRNRRVEIIAYYTVPAEEKFIELTPSFEDVEAQRFTINLDDTIVVTARQGTSLRIEPGSITTRSGMLAKGKAEIIIREYYEQGDILMAGLHTNSERGLLQSGGMFYMSIVQDGDTMAATTKKPIKIKMPARNNIRGNMTVYTLDQVADTAIWNNTGRTFRYYTKQWNWPFMNGKLQDVHRPDIRFENWRVGGVMEETYRYPLGWFWNDYGITKKIWQRIVHVDSTTLEVDVKLRFRKKVVRRNGWSRDFDTSFQVKYTSAVYEGFTSTLNWINCDRFLDYPEVKDFYVSTPGFNGGTLLVYFKSLNATMPAYRIKKGRFKIERVPPGEKVWLIAFGKNGNQHYFSKKAYTTTAGSTESLTMTKISKEDLKKELRDL